MSTARASSGSRPELRAEHDVIHRVRALAVGLQMFGAEFAARHHLHQTDVRALIVLLDCERAGESANPGLLAARLTLGSAAVTALLDRMEGAGLVARERDPSDRRRIHLTVTDHAVRMGDSFFGPLIDRAVGVLDEFTDAEIDVVRRFLDRMNDTVDEMRSV